MNQQKIATRIVEQKLRPASAAKLALASIFEKFAIGPQDIGPGSGFTLRPDSPLTAREQTASRAASSQQWESANRPAPPRPFDDGVPSDWDKGVANSKRIGSGILHAVAGLGAQGLAAADRAENSLWNFLTPKSMRTSQEHADTLQRAKQQLAAGTADAANDVVNGLNINNQDYFAPTATERAMGKTYEMPNPAGGLARLSRGALDLGDRTWENAQAVMSVRGAAGILNKVPGIKETATSAQKAYETAVPAAVRYGTAYTTGIPAAGNMNPYIFAGSMGGQAVLGNTLRGIAQREASRGNTGLADTLTGVSGMLPANLVPNTAAATLGPEAANYATNLVFAPAIGTQLTPNTGMYNAGYPALTAASDAIREPSGVSGAQFQEDSPPAAQTLAAGQFPQIPQEQRARVGELMGQLAQFDDASLESPEARAITEELQTIFNSSASEAQSTAISDNSAPGTRPFVDEEPTTPAAPAAQPAANEPDLSDPFGDKEQPSPQLPPGAEYLPPNAKPEDAEAAVAAFAAVPKTPETQAAVSNINSSEAQKKIQEGQNTYVETGAADYAKANPPPTNSPQDWGDWLKNMMDHVNTSWNNMSQESQLAFGLGVPMAVIGLLSGNVGGFLLGAVGLGTAGIAAAGSGMFGDTAQTGAEQATGSGAAQASPAPAFDYTPDNATQFLTELSKSNTNPISNWMSSRGTVAQFMNDPANRPKLDAILARPPDELRNVYGQLNADTQTALVERLQFMHDNAPDDPNTAQNEQLQTQKKVNELMSLVKKSGATVYSNKIAAQIAAMHLVQIAQKNARCWKGYEPVPGKKPYSEDSCRPQGSKKKKKMKKKAEDYLSFLSSDKPAILTLIRGYYDKQTGPQSKKIRAQGNS